jgi:5'-nucleotidase/UDP-sugar diphosphatase
VKSKTSFFIVLLTIALFQIIYAISFAEPITFTLIHVNDTHSHLDPEAKILPIDGNPTQVQLGGLTFLKTALDRISAADNNILFLHAGDAVQGTMYFIKFNGQTDQIFLNHMPVTAMTLGNHEFDRTSSFLAEFRDGLSFPVLCSNIDTKADADLKGKFVPYQVFEIHGERIGIIGLITPEVITSSSPGKSVQFFSPEARAQAAVKDLQRQGINKIIVLSHIGIEADIQLARSVSGIDLIVGGHSHTLMGDFKAFGYNNEYPYPVIETSPDGGKVLIVQAWEWAKVLGRIQLSFDDEGTIMSYNAQPLLLIGNNFEQKWQDTNQDGIINKNDDYTPITAQNAPDKYQSILRYIIQSGQAGILIPPDSMKAIYTQFSSGLLELKNTVIAESVDDLIRNSNNSGPGPLIALSMLNITSSMGAQVALLNPGGVRTDFEAGEITVEMVYDCLPFQSTLVLSDLSGQELTQVLEDMVNYSISKKAYNANIYAYIAGFRIQLNPSLPQGSRVSQIEIKQSDGKYQPLELDKTYRLVTNSFLAQGGDGNSVLEKIPNKQDTGLIDADVFLEFIQGTTLKNPTEELVIIKE